ncbi:uncharacterized protein UHOD_11260 [Ustilago sp. UG-2017b]|nr:uncharacterized protein UHOD_11260 [Ustilago sp. UG-2017b]
MFPKSLLFAFVATSLFLANVGVEASPKPNRPDAFDSYPSDRFRKARVDKRYIPPSEFQEYYAKANGDGRVFVRRSDDSAGGNHGHQGSDCSPGQTRCHHPPPSNKGSLPAAAANLKKRSPLETSDLERHTPIVATTVKAKKPTPDTKITSDYVYPSRHQQGAPLPITITSLLFTTPADKGFLGICSLQEHDGKEDMNSEETTWWQQAFCKRCSDAGGKNRAEFPCSKDSNGAKEKEGEKEKEAAGGKSKDDRKIDGSGYPRPTVSGDKPKQADGGLV